MEEDTHPSLELDSERLLSSDESESEKYLSGEEHLLEGICSSPTPEPEHFTISKRLRECLAEANWRNITASVFLWLAFLACSAAFSLIGTFFPQEV